VDNAKPNKVYDPACGSGSLLLQYKKSLKSDPKKGYFGQEINITTYNLARMNMFLHDVNYTRFDIAHGDTLINPSENHKELEPFDAIVSNPPYSTKWEGKDNALLINDERFNKAGVLAPTSKADLAFVMHSLSWLSEKGSAAIVCFPGVMYRGGAERDIRKYMIEENFVDCVISLAPNLFFGTSIAVCILVLRKNKTDKNTLFINANEEFIKVTNKNMLSKENLENILKLYKDRKEVPHLTKLASIE
ncbi:type I restriction-modification system subunit M, partial [Campylobacter jejuni]